MSYPSAIGTARGSAIPSAGRAGGIALDPATSAYIAALVAAGVTPTAPQRAAIDAFIRAEKAASRWTALGALFLPIWNVTLANAINVKTLGSGTWVGGFTNSIGHVRGNGITGYFNTQGSFATFGASASSGYACALINTPPTGTTKAMLGSGAGANNTLLRQDTSPTVIARWSGSTTGQVSGVTSNWDGIISFSRFSGSRSIYQRKTAGRSTLISTAAANSGAPPVAKIYCGAYNNTDSDASAPVQFSDAEFGAFAFGAGLSDADDSAFTLSLKTLWEALTGLTLPAAPPPP